QHELQRAMVQELADLPERAVADAQPLAHGGMDGRGVVGPEGALHAHALELAADTEAPCLGLVGRKRAHPALMINERVGTARPAVARKVAWRAIDHSAQLAEPPRLQGR